MKKSVLVIGASSSIGIPLVDQLLNEGFQVIAQFRNGSKNLDILKDKFPEDLKLFQLDFESEELEQEIVSLLALCQENLFAVVHLPSMPPSIQPLYKTDIQQINRHFELQIKSLHYIFSGLHKKLTRSKDFRVIGISTKMIGMKPPPKGFGSYMIAKAAAASYFDCLDAEYREKGVKVNQILPSMFRSPLLEKLPEFVIESFVGGLEEDTDNALRPDRDIVPLVLYLLSTAGIHLQGQKIFVGN